MCIASILMENLWNCKFRELRLNLSTWLPRSTCFRRLRNFVVSARLLACEGRRKSLLRNNNLCYWKLALRRSWPFPQGQVVRNSQKRWRVPNTLRNESPPYNHIINLGIHFTTSHWKISKWNETICDIYLHNQDANIFQNNISQRMLSHWSQDVFYLGLW